MSGSDAVFDGDIPEIYDQYLVPLIFEVYAANLATRVAADAPGAVLETAAGSGVVTRALAPRLDGAAHYVVTDLSPAMLDRARQRQPVDARLSWQAADAMALPFEDAAFDAVICQFGVMFFPDRVAALAEARRVLRPGGRLMFSSWDRIEENVFADLVTRAAAELFPAAPPKFLARTPHGYHDIGRIAADLRAAGFARFEIDTETEFSRASEARIPAVAYCHGTPLRTEIAPHGDDALDRVTDHATAAITRDFGPGPVSGAIRAHIVSAIA